MKIKESIKKLLESEEISNYRISKETGIAQTTLSDYTKGKSDIGNMKLDHATLLYDYYLRSPLSGSKEDTIHSSWMVIEDYVYETGIDEFEKEEEAIQYYNERDGKTDAALYLAKVEKTNQ